MIFILLFTILFIILHTIKPQQEEKQEPASPVEVVELGKYYSVTWDLKTGEVKEETIE